MWLQLKATLGIYAVLCVILMASPTAAEGRAAGWLSVYTDDDNLTVISPQVSSSQSLSDQLAVGATLDADIITAATVDLRTAASPRGYREQRYGITVGPRWQPTSTTSLGLNYIGSFERDYHSHGVATSASHEWNRRRLTTTASLAARFDAVGRAGEPREQWRSLTFGSGRLEQGIILDPHTVATLAYELQLLRGFQASPYRFAAILWAQGGALLVPERVPDQRVRHAGRFDLRRSLSPVWFLSGGYRVYGDSWGILSHTGLVELQRSLLDKMVLLSVSGRGYYQGNADFYLPSYVASFGSVPRLRTADKMLATSWSALGSGRIDLLLDYLGPLRRLTGSLGLDIYYQDFIDVPRIDNRRAVILSVGVNAEY